MYNKCKLYFFILLLCLCCASCKYAEKAIFDMYTTYMQAEVSSSQSFSQYKGIDGRLFQVTVSSETPYFKGIVVYTNRMFFKEEMCVGIDQKALWEVGDTAEELDKHFTSDNNFLLAVDDSFFTLKSGNLYTETGLSYERVLGDNGEVLGSYSDLSYCFKTEQLALGNHYALITVKTTSGKQYPYNWKFLITQRE